MGAGEKERGTLETLLTAPVNRYQFLVGKTLTATLAGLFAAIVSILSIMGSVWFIEDIPQSILDTAMNILSPSVVGVLLSLLVPLTVFFAATKDALAGTLGMGHLALVYVSLFVLAAASLGACWFVLRSERVLFRT